MEHFIRASVAHLRGIAPKNRREKHILGLPLLGTGGGGGYFQAGELLKQLFPLCLRLCSELDVDVVVVSPNRDVYHEMLSHRSRLLDWSAVLSPAEIEKSDELGLLASQDLLTPFLGAGVSIGSGLPSWGDLLGQLCDRCGLTADERKDLKSLPFLDQASYLELRLPPADRPIGNMIASLLKRTLYVSLAHSIVAGWEQSGAITTNYDTQHEYASKIIDTDGDLAAKDACSVIPYSLVPGAKRWLLKMHGCVTVPRSIVLTRESYIRYEDERQALTGLVSSQLMLKTVLFLGFSLTDDNLHRSIDAWRKSAPRRHRAMAIMLIKNQIFDSLWDADISIFSMDTTTRDPQAADWARAGRRWEILLDRIAQQTFRDNSPHLLAPRFRELLSPTDKEFASLFRAFMIGLPPEARGGVGYKKFLALLADHFQFTDFSE